MFYKSIEKLYDLSTFKGNKPLLFLVQYLQIMLFLLLGVSKVTCLQNNSNSSIARAYKKRQLSQNIYLHFLRLPKVQILQCFFLLRKFSLKEYHVELLL